MTATYKGVPALPEISSLPQHHADCCLSLSTTLIQQIGKLQPPGSLVYSIGSGSGLLEALLQQNFSKTIVIGTEVHDSVNKYLSPANSISVNGTWNVYNKSSEATTWLFVYPRRPSLISHYLELPKLPETIVWLGPKKDWEDFRAPFLACKKFHAKEIEDAGLATYETMFVMTKEDNIPSTNASSLLSPSQIDEI
jgi:hypothetical protein